MDTWLRDVNEGFLFVLLLSLLVCAAELGFQIARRARARGEPAHEATAIQGAVLGLLALLLGFTFSLAVDRYEARKELIRDEANAIGTTYLRAKFLPEPQQTRIIELLRRYVNTRFELQEAGASFVGLHAVHDRSSRVQNDMWEQTISAAALTPESKTTALFIESLNETIDMHGKQMSSIRHRISVWIFVLLFLVALAATGLTGYASSSDRKQSAVLNLVVCLLISAVILLIFDLQRPARGLITVDMGSMSDARDGMRDL